MKKHLSVLALLLAVCLLFGQVGAFAEEADKYEVDTIKVGVASLPSSMDPTLNVGNATIRVHSNIFETLIYTNEGDGYALEPMLATEWTRLDDYTIQIKLRQGVKWHNGSELTTKDIQFSFDRLKQGITGSTLAASLMSTIDHVDIIDDYTCNIVTSTVDPLLETRLASNWGAWILPADYIAEVGDEGFAAMPIGTGPYKVVSYSPEKIVLERFEDYWGEKPYIQHLEYVLYAENSTRITALMTGEADIITQVPMDQVATLESAEGIRVASTTITNMHVVQFYIDGDEANPVNNKLLRQALSYAVDRQLLCDALWGGKAVVPQGHQYPEFGDLYFDDYPVESYDIEKAKELLAESGYNGELITYELRNGYYTFGNEAAEAIVDMWRSIGVNAQVVFKDSSDEDTIVRNWSNSMRFPDPAGGLWLLWGGMTEEEWSGMPESFKEYGAILTSSLDQETRADAARKLMEIFTEECPAILLYYPVENWGVREGIHWEPYASQNMNFRANGFWGTVEE